MRILTMSAVLVAICASGGCRSRQLAHDQDHIRHAVLDLHTSQIMDNLVRLRKGLPIVQLDYTNMTGTVTQTGNVNASATQSVVANRFFNIPAASLAASRVFTNGQGVGGSAQQVNQLTITAQPVLNSPEVYNAYLTFLKDEDHLRQSCEPPSCGAAIVVKCDEDCTEVFDCAVCDQTRKRKAHGAKVYYWVPVEYRDDFRRLCLYTVALRGQPSAVSSNFEVTVRGVTKTDPKDEDVYELHVKLDKSIPNDRGYMIATIGGRLYESKDELKILINRNDGHERAQPGTEIADKQKTDEVILSVSLKTLQIAKVDDLVKGLSGQKVSIRLENFASGGNATDRLLEDVRNQIELFRLGQLQPR
jgi:hypothetical protein